MNKARNFWIGMTGLVLSTLFIPARSFNDFRILPETTAPVNQVVFISSWTPTRVDLSTAAGRISLDLQNRSLYNDYCIIGSSNAPVSISTKAATSAAWVIKSSATYNNIWSWALDMQDKNNLEIGIWCQNDSGVGFSTASVQQHYRQ